MRSWNANLPLICLEIGSGTYRKWRSTVIWRQKLHVDQYIKLNFKTPNLYSVSKGDHGQINCIFFAGPFYVGWCKNVTFCRWEEYHRCTCKTFLYTSLTLLLATFYCKIWNNSSLVKTLGFFSDVGICTLIPGKYFFLFDPKVRFQHKKIPIRQVVTLWGYLKRFGRYI